MTGFESFFDSPPDLVILDIMMPELDGWEVCKEIRRFDKTPIIMLTGKGESCDKLKGFNLGTDDYLVKPFDSNERWEYTVHRTRGATMIMTPRLRKFALTAHVTSSVGWIGAVVGFLVLVVAALTTQEAQTVNAAWIAMKLIGWFAIVPLAFFSLLTGLIMSLGTHGACFGTIESFSNFC